MFKATIATLLSSADSIDAISPDSIRIISYSYRDVAVSRRRLGLGANRHTIDLALMQLVIIWVNHLYFIIQINTIISYICIYFVYIYFLRN